MPSYPLIRQDGGNYHIRLRPLKRRTTEASSQGTPLAASPLGTMREGHIARWAPILKDNGSPSFVM